jgi:protein phosphatase
MLDDSEVQDIMMSGDQPGPLVDILISEANRRGGLDNVTVIIVRIDTVEHHEDGRTAS